MIGTHADVVLSDAATAGLNFDYVTAYAGMYQGATEPQQNAGRCVALKRGKRWSTDRKY